MVSVDVSLFFQIANFLILIWVLNIIVYKPIRKILSQRKEKIEGLEKGAEKANTDALAKDDAFLSGVKEAREEGLKEKEIMLQSAAAEEKAIIEKINQESQSKLSDIREKISKETDEVRASLKKEVGEYADAICQKILGRAV